MTDQTPTPKPGSPAPAAAAAAAPATATAAATSAAGAEPKPAKSGPKLGELDAPPAKLTAADDDSDAAAAEDDGTAEGAAAADGDKPEAPVEYDLTPPEGREPYSQPVVDAYKKIAGEQKLTPAQAKALLEGMQPAIEQDTKDRVQHQIDQQVAAWQQELETRHGEDLGSVIRVANSALKKFASKELRQFIASSPLAANPDFIDMLANVGKRFSNDKSVKGSPDTPAAKLSAEERAAKEYEATAAAQR